MAKYSDVVLAREPESELKGAKSAILAGAGNGAGSGEDIIESHETGFCVGFPGIAGRSP